MTLKVSTLMILLFSLSSSAWAQPSCSGILYEPNTDKALSLKQYEYSTNNLKTQIEMFKEDDQLVIKLSVRQGATEEKALEILNQFAFVNNRDDSPGKTPPGTYSKMGFHTKYSSGVGIQYADLLVVISTEKQLYAFTEFIKRATHLLRKRGYFDENEILLLRTGSHAKYHSEGSRWEKIGTWTDF